MKKLITSLSAAGVLLLGIGAWAPDAVGQQDGPVQSLRGMVELNEDNELANITKLSTGKRFDRAYRQQPPLVPHKIDKYQINLKVNQCMRCHDWPYNTKEGAPKISETHYINREGVALDKVTRSRWFCTQCHVPQANAPALVRNDFKSEVGGR